MKLTTGGIDVLAKEYPHTFREDFFTTNEKVHNLIKQLFEMASTSFGSCVLVVKKYGSEDLANRMEAYQVSISPTFYAQIDPKRAKSTDGLTVIFRFFGLCV